MNEKQLRRIVREEVEATVAEASSGVPDRFTTFRKRLNAAMKSVPELWELLSQDMKDTGYEGEMVQPMWDSWMEMEYELEAAKKRDEDIREIWEEMLPDTLHDMFIDLGDLLANPWNFPPGEEVNRPDSDALGMMGQKVADIMLGRDPDYREKHAARGVESLGPVVQAIIDDLHGEGANVQANVKDTFAMLIIGIQNGAKGDEVLAYLSEGFTSGRYGVNFTASVQNTKRIEFDDRDTYSFSDFVEDPKDTYTEWKSENILAWIDDQSSGSFTLAIDYTGE